MQGNTESDYLLFIEDKAIVVVEAKKESNPLGVEVEKRAEGYAVHLQPWCGLWFESLIPLVYMANHATDLTDITWIEAFSFMLQMFRRILTDNIDMEDEKIGALVEAFMDVLPAVLKSKLQAA